LGNSPRARRPKSLFSCRADPREIFLDIDEFFGSSSWSMALKAAGVTTRCLLWPTVLTTFDEWAVVAVEELPPETFSLITGEYLTFSFLLLTLPGMADPSTCAGVLATFCSILTI